MTSARRPQWVEVGDVDVDIGANPSAEEAEEGVESGAKKVVNLQDAFRLQEGPSYSKKELMAYLKVGIVATMRGRSGCALLAAALSLETALQRVRRARRCMRGVDWHRSWSGKDA